MVNTDINYEESEALMLAIHLQNGHPLVSVLDELLNIVSKGTDRLQAPRTNEWV